MSATGNTTTGWSYWGDDGSYSDGNNGILIITSFFLALLFIYLCSIVFFAFRRRQLANRRYKMKQRRLYFDEDLYGKRSTSVLPIPSWNSNKSDKITAPLRGIDVNSQKNSLMSGVPTILMSNHSATPIISDKKVFMDSVLPVIAKLQNQSETLAQWYVDNESALLQKLGETLKPGSMYEKIFSETPHHELTSKDDVWAIQHIISFAIHKNILSIIGSSQYNVQCLAAYLKAVKSLFVSRSVISLLDWEVFAHMKEYLVKEGSMAAIMIERPELLNIPNLVLLSIQQAQREVYNKLRNILPLTFSNNDTTDSGSIISASTLFDEIEDPSNGRLQTVLYESLILFFVVKSYHPLYSFVFAESGSNFNKEWMKCLNKNDDITIVRGAVSGAILGKNGVCKIKANVF